MSRNTLTATVSAQTRKHGLLIRIAHIGLAIAVMNQLLTSLVLSAPAPDAAGNFYFEVHEYGGLIAFSFITLFWFGVIFRKRHAPSGLMFPWLSAVRLSALWSDTKLHFAAIAGYCHGCFRYNLLLYKQQQSRCRRSGGCCHVYSSQPCQSCLGLFDRTCGSCPYPSFFQQSAFVRNVVAPPRLTKPVFWKL